MGEPEFTTVGIKIADLAIASGNAGINQLPGAWFYKVDDNWAIAANGHNESTPVPDDSDYMQIDLPPYHLAAWYNGWLAAIMTPFSGEVAAGDVANEDALIAALDAAIAREKEKNQ